MTPEAIAHYKITGKLGEGGMGAVYRALDTKLNREVAIKVLPESFAQDPDRMARFAREAQVLASLNHPNIAAIHGVEDRAIVMELVEGRPLSGPLPLEEALPIIHQLIDALEYAHEKGVVHRDLKPANIMITPEGRVKILDFGLAKAMGEDKPAGDPATSPTLTMRATVAGMIMGTAGYMSPEQARGHSVDKRADIWAFGVVVYELVTGKRLFEGATVSDTLASVLRHELDLSLVPVQLRRMVGACLVRDVRHRMRDIGDARLLIEQTAEAPALLPANSRASWIAAAAAILLAAVLGLLLWRATRPEDRPLYYLPVDLGADAVLGIRGTIAVSPDGSRIVYPARSPEGKQLLATRLLNQAKGSLLAGTEDGTLPFFSPDGQWVGFFADSKLKKISIQGGGAVNLCDAFGGRGASWGDDGNIIATLNNTAGLSRVPESGGEPKPVTNPADSGELSHRWPQVLPGSKVVLYSANKIVTDWDQADIIALSLETGKTTVVHRGGFFGRYLPGGYLVYIRDGTLWGVAFNPDRPEIKGSPVPLLDDIAGHTPSGGGHFDFSQAGLLVYLSGKAEDSQVRVGWMDPAGKFQPFAITPGLYSGFRLSPDGKQLAFTDGNTGRLSIYDLARETVLRITPEGLGSRDMVWTRDGKHLAYSSYAVNSRVLSWVRSDGAGGPQPLLDGKNARANSFSPDGRLLAFVDIGGISMLRLDLTDPDHPKPGQPEIFIKGPPMMAPSFSPDGRWLAYESLESGTRDIYVQAFGGAPGKWPVSQGGGKWPIWSRDGRQLLYATIDNYVMVVACAPERNAFIASKPRRWSETPIHNAGGFINFDIAPDGKRIVAAPATEREDLKGNLHLTFLVNFFDELRRRVPK